MDLPRALEQTVFHTALSCALLKMNDRMKQRTVTTFPAEREAGYAFPPKVT
jgi:hypothetical protein